MRKGWGVFLGAAAFAAGACSGDPALYLGGPAGPPVALDLSSHNLTVIVGDSTEFGANALDAVGNRTSVVPTITACDGAVSVGSSAGSTHHAVSAWIRGTGLGVSCVVVSGGGLSDTAVITAAPASVRIAGDPILGFDNQDPAANVFTFGVDAFDRGGNALTGSVPYAWSSSTPTLLSVNPTTGEVTTKSLGTASVRVVAPGGANDALGVTVGAPLLNGTASATSGGQGDLITITRTGGPVFDANTEAYLNFGGVRTFVDGTITADQIRIVVPATGVAAGRSDIVLRKVGPDDVDRRVIFQATTGGTSHRYTPASDACSTAPDYNAEQSPANWVYFSFTEGSVGYGGSKPDIWFKYTNSTASSQTVDVRFEWLSPNGSATVIADADLFGYLGCGTSAIDASQDYNPPNPPEEELIGLVVPAGGSLQVRAIIFDDQGAAFSNARIRVQ